ncbi:hypothetical protein QJS10_CPA08g01875 [Acorus calamus]|uniref:J domain-containing protein n=1 Tax=Acorus calamus TaxID=4465 RepID=A0AAV9E960_ACOCL|nr:hypothetical protein QJS10_CPA08g01875 [Acorus calamus]
MLQRTLTLAPPTPVRLPLLLRRRPMTLSAVASISVRRPPATATNLYEVLRVKETASPVEIKKAYRSLAKRFHPDASPSAVAAAEAASEMTDGGDFIEIHRAYSTLSDPTARARYDVSIGRLRFVAAAGGRRTRRWETDQCW